MLAENKSQPVRFKRRLLSLFSKTFHLRSVPYDLARLNVCYKCQFSLSLPETKFGVFDARGGTEIPLYHWIASVNR